MIFEDKEKGFFFNHFVVVAINFTDQRMWEAEALKLGPFRRLRLSSLTWKKTSWALFKRVKESIHVRKLPSQALLLKRRTDTIFIEYHLFRPTHHGVWKSKKKSHSTLRAKRATFTFWVDKTSLKMPKKVNLGEFLKNATFWEIFKHCATSHFLD